MSRSFDRALAMGAIVLALAAFLLPHASDSAGATAHAAPAGPPDLGPTDGVLFTDAKPAAAGAPGTVRLRAAGGRLTWADQPTAKAWSIGVVHVDKVMKAVLATASYVSKRQEIEGEAKKQDEEFGKRLQELQAKYPSITPESSEFEGAQKEFAALREEYGRWREGALRIQEKFLAEQVETAYREMRTAVEIVCDREGIDIVMRTLAPGDPFEANSFAEARDNVVGRALLRYPEELDITELVLKELSIQP